jgi:prepilin-type N-terminal cleavage/methylation domain-containing protein
MTKLNRGFTLIELLVVIAIIGILSTIVLASLSTARTKGEDAAIQSTLQSMKTQAELYYSNANPSSYGVTTGAVTVTTCNTAGTVFAPTGTGTLGAMITSVKQRSTAVRCSTGLAGAGTMTSWGVEALLKTNQYFCVDSTGNSTTTAATTLGDADSVCG